MSPVADDAAHVVRLWWSSSAAAQRYAAPLGALLDSAERARAERIRSVDGRRRFVAAHALTRLVLAPLAGGTPHSLALETGARGKPRLASGAPPHFSLAHSGDTVAVAVAPRELGLDVESLRAIPNRERLARRFLSEEERRWLAARPAHRGDRGFLVLWTAKEAYLKAVGSGIAMALREVEVDGERPRLLRIVGDPNTAADWTLLRADLPEPAIATAAIRDTGWRLEVSEVDWQEALSQLDSHS